jgi:hypothetical protein
MVAGAAAMVLLAGAAGVWWLQSSHQPAARSDWVQLTNLPDSVTQPALSPDGRTLAFLRGPNTFVGKAQLYVKMLPDGEPVQVTHDNSRKMSPVFSPDGARIAYTVLSDRFTWDTWTIPVLGGTPQPWLANAEGLLWIDRQRLLFSEIKQGRHMAIVTSLESRADSRDVYVPPHEAGMAHRSYPSPDHRWVLIVEMDGTSAWTPCRLAPFDGSSPGRQVGPPGGPCTFAAHRHRRRHAGPADADSSALRGYDLQHPLDIVIAVRRHLAADGTRSGISHQKHRNSGPFRFRQRVCQTKTVVAALRPVRRIVEHDQVLHCVLLGTSRASDRDRDTVRLPARSQHGCVQLAFPAR